MQIIRLGPIYERMQKESMTDLMVALFGDRFGSDDPYVASIVKGSYNKKFGKPINDFDIGRYDPKTGISIASYFPDGRKLTDEEIDYVFGHERSHEYRFDEVDAAMHGERLANPELWLKVMGWRAAMAKAGENSKDAQIYRGILERYSGTEFGKLLSIIDKIGEGLLQNGAYDEFRKYELSLSNRN